MQYSFRNEVNRALAVLKTDRKGLARRLELSVGTLRSGEAREAPAYGRLLMAAIVAGIDPSMLPNGDGSVGDDIDDVPAVETASLGNGTAGKAEERYCGRDSRPRAEIRSFGEVDSSASSRSRVVVRIAGRFELMHFCDETSRKVSVPCRLICSPSHECRSWHRETIPVSCHLPLREDAN